MRGFLIFLGVLLALGGGALAGIHYAPVDLAPLNAVAGAKEFVVSPMALYAGGGAAGFGLLLIVIGAAMGGAKKAKPAKATTPAPDARRAGSKPTPAAPAPKAAPAPTAPVSKPTASAFPPQAPMADDDPIAARLKDPRLLNRKRVSDLVSINDALKVYHAANGAYPKAAGLAGFSERGTAWIPGLSPDFIVNLPRDPVHTSDASGPQYVYVSDGKDYKLLAHGVSLLGGTQVEVLGVRIDPTRNPTAEKASFGFWTAGFASA